MENTFPANGAATLQDGNEEEEEEKDFLNVCSLLALPYSRHINVLL